MPSQAAGADTESGKPASGPSAQESRETASTPKITLVTFDRACMCVLRSCRQWTGIIDDVVGHVEGVAIERVDTERDAQRYQELCRKHGVDGVPLAFVFGGDGALVEVFSGNLGRERLDAAVKRAIGGSAALPAGAGPAGEAAKAFAAGEALLENADFDGALEAFKAAAQADAGSPQYGQQYAVLRQVIQMRNRWATERDADRWLKMAGALRTFYYTYDLFAEALPLDKERFQRYRSADSAVNLAETQLALEMHDEAVETLRSLAEEETSPRTRVLHALALARLGQIDEAKKVADEPQQVTDDMGPRYFYDLARLEALVGHSAHAFAALTRSFELTPPSRAEAFRVEARKCEDFGPLASSADFTRVLETPSKIEESGCSMGPGCGQCPKRAECEHGTGASDKKEP